MIVIVLAFVCDIVLLVPYEVCRIDLRRPQLVASITNHALNSSAWESWLRRRNLWCLNGANNTMRSCFLSNGIAMRVVFPAVGAIDHCLSTSKVLRPLVVFILAHMRVNCGSHLRRCLARLVCCQRPRDEYEEAAAQRRAVARRLFPGIAIGAAAAGARAASPSRRAHGVAPLRRQPTLSLCSAREVETLRDSAAPKSVCDACCGVTLTRGGAALAQGAVTKVTVPLCGAGTPATAAFVAFSVAMTLVLCAASASYAPLVAAATETDASRVDGAGWVIDAATPIIPVSHFVRILLTI